MGLSLLLGPLMGKLIAGLAIVAGLVAAYFGIRASGARAERQKTELATAAARQEAQAKLDVAQSQDAKIDAQAKQDIAAVRPPVSPAPPAKPPAVGDKFKFLIPILLMVSLWACTRSVVGNIPVVVLPPMPTLTACPVAPHPEGTIITLPDGTPAVALALPDAQAIKNYLETAQPCWVSREILLQAYIQKLENRLQAVGGQVP